MSPPRRRLTPREQLERAMPEYAWQALVIDIAHLGGFRVLHILPASQDGRHRTPVAADGKGYPDMTCVKPGRIVVAELKRVGRYPTPEQRVWLEAWRAAGAEAYLWDPRDEDEVWLVLAGRERP